MDVFLTEKEIDDLILEPKVVEGSQLDFLRMKSKKGHNEKDFIVSREDGSHFRIIIRQSLENSFDFSVVLGYCAANQTGLILLRRYNGKSHEHSNRIEKEKPFYDFHIHTATERYQKEGPRAEYYAEMTDRYSDINGAIKCLIKDCNINFSDLQEFLF